jgi:hypothetical protein
VTCQVTVLAWRHVKNKTKLPLPCSSSLSLSPSFSWVPQLLSLPGGPHLSASSLTFSLRSRSARAAAPPRAAAAPLPPSVQLHRTWPGSAALARTEWTGGRRTKRTWTPAFARQQRRPAHALTPPPSPGGCGCEGDLEALGGGELGEARGGAERACGLVGLGCGLGCSKDGGDRGGRGGLSVATAAEVASASGLSARELERATSRRTPGATPSAEVVAAAASSCAGGMAAAVLVGTRRPLEARRRAGNGAVDRSGTEVGKKVLEVGD